ncbi:hypothetical protein CEXT_798501 [Caerostris extrusa]|uniref:Uncharacterized protein n=1 Tax=Caerostris extrusa TaxID=172846 RepID=A0AAV4WVY1_CAEEX|nr:hypothetical protein CEXT_798501 [Caerostris extrusa]
MGISGTNTIKVPPPFLRSSSSNWVPDVDSRFALLMNYDAEGPATNQINSSMQQSCLHGMHQQNYCEERDVNHAEMVI